MKSLIAICCVLLIATSTLAASKPDPPSKKLKPAAVTKTENTRTENTESDEHSEPVTTETASDTTETSPAAEAPPQGGGKWEFAVTPYLFLARLDGLVGVVGQTAQVNASFRDIFRNLDFAAMGTFEARKGNWMFVGDMMYMSLSGQKITPSVLFSDIDVKVKETIIDPEVGYRVLKTERGSIDLMGGARIWHVKAHLTFQPLISPLVDVEGSRTWIDPVIGARGTTSLSPRVFIHGKFDMGGFGINSDFTGQAFGGVGFQVKPRIALLGGYRYLRVDYVKEGFIFKTALSGIALGAKFSF
jgi:hypothetical protein